MPSPASVFEQRIADKKGELVKAASVVASELLSYTSDDLQKSEKAVSSIFFTKQGFTLLFSLRIWLTNAKKV